MASPREAPYRNLGKEQLPLSLEVPACNAGSRTFEERTQASSASGFGYPEQPQLKAMPVQSAPQAVQAIAEATRVAPTFVALTDLATLRAAGIAYPASVHGWRWLFRHRHERGLQDAFRRIGRRIVVDLQRYRELVRERPSA